MEYECSKGAQYYRKETIFLEWTCRADEILPELIMQWVASKI
jgi:hypothetical protein